MKISKLNILLITPRIPYPPYRGDKLKIFNISRVLSKSNSVHIITFYQREKDKAEINELEKLGIKVSLVKLTLLESFLNSVIAIFQNIPFQVAWYKSRKMKNKIDQLLADEKFDVVYHHLIRTAQYLSHKKEEARLNVIDFTDAVSLYLSRMVMQEKNIIKRLFIKSELHRIINYEKIAEKFDAVFICSEIDRKFLLAKGINKDVQILANGIDTHYFSGAQIEYDHGRIIFTGNMPYYANSDAAIFFVKEIFPKVLAKQPEAKFHIVGQKPPRRIKNLQSDNIIVTGFVPDIKQEYLKSAVNVAPMRFGAGTLNKVIESIALGVPVVATSLAVGGLPEILQKFIFIVDDANEFAEKVIYIINNPTIRSELSAQGKTVVTDLLSWDRVMTDFEYNIRTRLTLNTSL